jgi:pentatricopeptide repeat protein
MIACYLSAGKPAEAREVARKMVESGVSPNHVTYKVFLAELLSNSQLAEARKLFELQLKNSKSMTPHDYGEIATRFYRAGDSEKGLEVYEFSMEKFGCASGTAHSYSIDAYSFKKADDKVERIRDLCMENKSLLASCCHALLRHYIRRFSHSESGHYSDCVDKIYAASVQYGFKISPNIDFKCKEVIAAAKTISK